jgi:DNA polymerase-3 subunit delta'
MNWNLVGHEHAVNSLMRALKTDRLRHAYLIAGAAGVGKRTLAMAFIKAVLCQNTDAPCGERSECRSCKLIDAGNHPDVITLAPLVSGKVIKTEKIVVDRIRELIRALNLKPVEASRKVALITNFETANEESSNAFLKTLEEPPGNALLILTTDIPEMLLETIKSRCEMILLKPLPTLMIQNALTSRWSMSGDRAELLARLSGGRLGWAVTADESILERREQRLDELYDVIHGSRLQRFAYAEKLYRDRDLMKEALDLWIGWWRDVMLIASNATTPPINIDQLEALQRTAAHVGLDASSKVVDSIQRTTIALMRNANARLALEVLLLEMPRVG